MKLELILRLLDNDELSPEQVNDVKDFLDDYVERNQVDLYQNSSVCFQVSSYNIIYFFLYLMLYRRTLMNLVMLMSFTSVCR